MQPHQSTAAPTATLLNYQQQQIEGLNMRSSDPVLRVTLNGIFDPSDPSSGQAYELLPLPSCLHSFVVHAGGFYVMVLASAANLALMEAMKRWDKSRELTMVLVDSAGSVLHTKIGFTLSKASRMAFANAAKSSAYSRVFKEIRPLLPEIVASSKFKALAIPENALLRDVVCAVL